jgi:hypothetical protein
MLIAALICGALVGTAAAQPAPAAAAVDLNAEQRALIAQLTADRAISGSAPASHAPGQRRWVRL